MDMSGEVRIPAPQQRVWEALNDPETLRQAIPGCEELTKISDTELEAAARAKIGPVSARFKGKVTLSDLEPPNGYTLSGEGTGGAAGFAKGQAQVTLRPDGDGTVLHYTVKATVGGKLAQIGQRLIDGAAKKMADDFFEKFSSLAAGPAAPGPQAAMPAHANDDEHHHPNAFNLPLWVPIAAIAAGFLLLAIVLMR
ncbi:MAG: carbon monoxide dehydrogenase [Alphaproteobacteria bacterium]|nr:carbon monoxide dehydrogenase [Alphaproteobacteria bacterium]